MLRQGRRAFLLNPPADPSTDIDAEERASVEAILAALDGSGLERVVALSTYGVLPMVVPDDVGRIAARLLTADSPEVGRFYLRHVEGPDRYTAGDVAAAFATALDRPVEVVAVPRSQWQKTFGASGFSAIAARSSTRMTTFTADHACDMPAAPERGTTSLHAYISQLVRRVSQAHDRREQRRTALDELTAMSDDLGLCDGL